MDDTTLDLGQDNGGDETSPVAATPPATTYPSVMITHPNVHKLPNKGTAKIKYKVKERHSYMHGKKPRHSATIELHSISHPPVMKKTSSSKEDEDAMQAIMNNNNNDGNH